MKTTKSQVEVLQMLKDVSKGLGLSFEIESHSETLSVYRISYKQGAFQFTCITSGDSTSLDMEIVSYIPLKRSYQIVPKMIRGPFSKYYNSILMPALNKALGNQKEQATAKDNNFESKGNSLTSSQTLNANQVGFQTIEKKEAGNNTWIVVAIVTGILIAVFSIVKSRTTACDCVDIVISRGNSLQPVIPGDTKYNNCMAKYNNTLSQMSRACMDEEYND
ncbi:hypothetical protein N8Z92_03890 [Schleiferiaceae bacterium]|nr:hypothetical protein [Schleiferiaceae bacterium]MDC1493639.1 hypothetical protein [Schleiferiaceae bacterium]MDC1537761.1 hypothetical protein [Schleiferiaceae bacterium]